MPRIPALLEERRGYVLRGLTDRVALVDAALAAEGHQVETADASPVVETASIKRGPGRPRKPTAD